VVSEIDGELAEDAAIDAAHQQDRHEDGDQRDADRDHGEPHLLSATQRRLEAVHALLDVAGDVLKHHDGVVDDEAGGDGERHERQVVERETEQEHHAKAPEQRDRHRDARDQHGDAVHQEEGDDAHHEDGGDDHRPFDIIQRGADGRGAVDRDLHVDVLRQGALHCRQARLHPVDRRDDVGAGLAADGDDHRLRGNRLAVRLVHEDPLVTDVFLAVDHLSDVREPDRRAVAVGDQERRVVGRRGPGVVGVDLQPLGTVLDDAFRTVGVGRGERGADVFEAHAIAGEGQGIELDPDGRQGGAAYAHVAHPFHL
jgi:hypothetical protein